MEIEKIEVGSLETNCYVLRSENQLGIVDPGGNEEKIVNELSSRAIEVAEVKFVLATHFHWDHVDAAPTLIDRLNTDFYLGEKDLELFEKSTEFDLRPDRLLKEGNRVEIGGNSLTVWETPGHSPGSITLTEEDEGKLLVGDLLFSTGFGRTDLPGGSRSDLEKSLARVVNSGRNWEVFPGHGPVFRVEDRLNSSPLLEKLREE